MPPDTSQNCVPTSRQLWCVAGGNLPLASNQPDPPDRTELANKASTKSRGRREVRPSQSASPFKQSASTGYLKSSRTAAATPTPRSASPSRETAWNDVCLLAYPHSLATPPSTKATASTKVRCVEVFTCAFALNHGRHEHDLPSRTGSEPRPAASCARLPSNADPSCIAFPKERCSEPPSRLGRRADPGGRRPTQHGYHHSSYKKLRT